MQNPESHEAYRLDLQVLTTQRIYHFTVYIIFKLSIKISDFRRTIYQLLSAKYV
jgi:hypothetical protein